MADVQSVEFTINVLGRIDDFSLRTVKGRTVCFSTKKSAVRIVL